MRAPADSNRNHPFLCQELFWIQEGLARIVWQGEEAKARLFRGDFPKMDGLVLGNQAGADPKVFWGKSQC